MRLMRIVRPFLYGLSNSLIALRQISFGGVELEVEVDADDGGHFPSRLLDFLQNSFRSQEFFQTL